MEPKTLHDKYGKVGLKVDVVSLNGGSTWYEDRKQLWIWSGKRRTEKWTDLKWSTMIKREMKKFGLKWQMIYLNIDEMDRIKW